MEKKIIIFMPSIEGGGVEKNLFLVSNYLTTKFKKMCVITVSKSYKSKFKKSIEFISYSSDVWEKYGRRFKYFLALILLIKEILYNKNPIVFSFQANVYCVIICKLFGIKVIVRSNSAPFGWSKNPIKNYVFKIFLNLADKVMVNSLEFKKDLKKNFNVNAKCIYNPLNTKEILKKSKEKKINIFKSNKKLKILNIGRYTYQKDQLTLLKSLKYFNKRINYELVIIGRGILKKKLENFIDSNNLSNKVRLINFVNNPYTYIKQADLFILTSKFEGLPNVLLEALVLKKFIISSNCRTGPKEILLNGNGGLLFKVGNYKDLAKKFNYYSKNKKKCQQLLKNAIKNLDRFDYYKNLNEYYNLVKSVR